MISAFFIRRPIFASVISLVIILLGSVALIFLPVERYPDIAPPTINISASYPGADARTVADTVAAPIEQEVNGVEHMIYMSSVSANDGSMNLQVTFETGTDLDMANVLTQNRVSAAEPKLPEEVRRQGVLVKKKSTDVNLFIGFFSPNGTYDDLFLSNYLSLRIKDEIARVPGVGEVKTFGVGDYSMRIWLDPDKLFSRGLTADDVVQAVREQNVQVPAGQIGEPPAPPGQAFQFTVNVQGRLVDPEEFGAIVIRADEEGRMIRVRDVARVELGSASYIMTSELNGLPSATMAVYQIPGANAIEISADVRKRLKELSRSFPEDFDYIIVYDNTNVIMASVREVVTTLFITLILVVLTVYIFLQDVRSTLVPAITIPVALIGTFAAMAMLGYSINQFTLFGLVLVIGIVVDDSIVVVENTSRHLQEPGITAKEAAVKAMEEVTAPVIATTLVLLAVFVPTTAMSGITGQLFRQFAVTISVATVFSTINALSLSPALCALVLRPPDPSKKPPIFFRGFNRAMEFSTKGYGSTVRLILRRSFIGFVIFAILSGLAFVGLSRMPTGFVPQEDEGYCMVQVQLPDAASQERTRAVMKKVNRILEEEPGIKDFLSITGYSILDIAAVSSMGFSVAVFPDWAERGPELHQSRILARLNQRFAEIQDAIVYAFPMPSLPGIGTSGGLTVMLQDRGGGDLHVLQKASQRFVDAGNAQSGLTEMRTTFRAEVPQIFVDIAREQVLAKNVSMSAVYNALQYFLGSVYINDLTLFNRIFQVKAQAESRFRTDPDQIRQYRIRNRDGDILPLGAVVEVREVLGPQTVTRYNMYPSAKILGQPADGFSSGQAMELVEDMAAKELPSTMGIEWTELSYQEKLATGGTGLIFMLSVLLVYLVLAAQYESWSLPISVCLAVPSALLGAVVALNLRGMNNDVYTQVGIVLLIGLSTKTAILIVEFAKDRRDAGKSAFDAAIEASHLRFRAVLMTAFSFILGVIPLLVASGAGAESRKVLGTTVFGGMLIATVVGLLFVPLFYFIVDRGMSNFGRGRKRKPAAEE